jgi:hypothetical protein
MDHGHGDPNKPDTIANMPHQHAFVMLGTKTLFLCHLTMYGWEEHMYQLVVQATLPDWAMTEYAAARKPDDSYFLGNSPRDLFTLPEINSGARTWFIADVFRGIPNKPEYKEWPWNGMSPVIANVRVTVERVVLYRLFAMNMEYPKTLTYVLFGCGDEAHMTNYQTKEPDFDHILSLEKLPQWVPERELEAGIVIDVPDVPGRENGKVRCSNPLDMGKEYSVRYRGRQGDKRLITAGQTFWFCTKVANSSGNPCPDTAQPCGSNPR